MNSNIQEILNNNHCKDVLAIADIAIQKGGTVYAKWTCKGCGERVMCDTPNSFFTSFIHQDCGYETKTVDGDLGFLLVTKVENLG